VEAESGSAGAEFRAPATRRGRSAFAPTAATTVRARDLGPVQIVRTRARLESDDDSSGYVDPGDAFVWCLTTNGSIEVRSGFDVVVPSGSVRLGFMPRIDRFQTTTDWRAVSIRMDRSVLDLTSAEIDEITRATFSLHEGVPFLLGALATQVMKEEGELGTASTASLARSILDLTTSFADDYFGRRTAPEVARGALVGAARHHIELYSSDPGLQAEGVAAALGVPLRTLQRAFQSVGGVGGAILDQRLRTARSLLARHHQQPLSVQQVARRSGFSSHSSFSRAFKTRFGASPLEWRRECEAIRLSGLDDSRHGY
jgi:AraC-like DNA-binding protein